MKRILPILLLVAIAACSKEYTPPASPNLPEISLNRNNSITLDDIHEYLSGYKNIKDTKSASISVEAVLEGTDTVMYLINYLDGWELLSADRRAPRVFAMAETGNVTIEDFMSIPALYALYNKFVSNVEYLKQSPEQESDVVYQDNWNDVLPDRTLGWELVSTTVTEDTEVVPHLTQTRWGQGYPWNCRMPYENSYLQNHCLAGCVPVAAGQVLYYLHQKWGIPSAAYGESATSAYVPSSGSLILQSNDVQFDATTYSSSTWNTMPLTNTATGSFAAVSTLLLQMGLYLEAEYEIGGTSAYTSDIASVFEDGFSIYSTGSYVVDFDIISDQIMRHDMPVILSIAYYYNYHRYGHSVIADACKETTRQIKKVYRRQIPSPDPELFPQYEYQNEITVERLSRYVGINWGWNGSYMTDGIDAVWFSADAISWDVGDVYTHVEHMIYGFHID